MLVMVEIDAFKMGETAGKLMVGAQDGRRAEKAALREAAAHTPELELAAIAHAKRIAVREQFLLNLWRPLAKWAGVSQEYFRTEFPKELAAKLADVEDTDLQTPKAAIVAPAMEALGYSLDEPALKDMYLNLLAGASMKTKAAQVHPSFVDTIRQLSSEEAGLLDLVLWVGELPLARIMRVYSDDHTYNVLRDYVVNLLDSQGAPREFPMLAVWIDNWQRLGLVNATFSEHRVDRNGDDLYAWVSSRPEWVEAKNSEPVPPEGDQPEWRIDYDKEILRKTARGSAFHNVVKI